MYINLVALDKEKHKTLKVSPLNELSFLKDTSFLPLLAQEVAIVGNSFPVVFTTGKKNSIVTLLSLGGRNLAINEDGKWITNYTPSIINKYPLALASSGKAPNEQVILIDEGASIVSKSKGKQLFRKNGEQSDILKEKLEFMLAYDRQMLITQQLADEIKNSGILEDGSISVGKDDQKKVLVNGFQVVNREKLNSLDDELLAKWVRNGTIALIESHMRSLNNVQAMLNLEQQANNKEN